MSKCCLRYMEHCGTIENEFLATHSHNIAAYYFFSCNAKSVSIIKFD